jgi:hypothetical protein
VWRTKASPGREDETGRLDTNWVERTGLDRSSRERLVRERIGLRGMRSPRPPAGTPLGAFRRSSEPLLVTAVTPCWIREIREEGVDDSRPQRHELELAEAGHTRRSQRLLYVRSVLGSRFGMPVVPQPFLPKLGERLLP